MSSRILDQIKDIFLVFHKATSDIKRKMIPAKYHGKSTGRSPRHAENIAIPKVSIPPQTIHMAPNQIIKSDKKSFPKNPSILHAELCHHFSQTD